MSVIGWIVFGLIVESFSRDAGAASALGAIALATRWARLIAPAATRPPTRPRRAPRVRWLAPVMTRMLCKRRARTTSAAEALRRERHHGLH